MKYIIFFIPFFLMASFEGKRTYHNNSIDKKVEFSKRHNENPFRKKSNKQQIIETSKGRLSALKREIANKKIERQKFKVKKKTDTILGHGDEKRKILKTSKRNLKDLKKDIKTNRIKPKKITGYEIEKKKKILRKKKGYKR